MTDQTRRGLLAGLAASGAFLLSGCDKLGADPSVRRVLGIGEGLNERAQRFLQGRDALAREFSRADISPTFKANGTLMPGGDDYAAHLASGFADWRLRIDGLV